MGKTRQKNYGKSIAKILGYNVRILFKDGKNPSGKFGIFAGKKMLSEAKNLEAATAEINKLATTS